MTRRKIFCGLTKECMERILAGAVEHIQVDDQTELEIRYSDKLPQNTVGVRGPGVYVFND